METSTQNLVSEIHRIVDIIIGNLLDIMGFLPFPKCQWQPDGLVAQAGLANERRASTTFSGRDLGAIRHALGQPDRLLSHSITAAAVAVRAYTDMRVNCHVTHLMS